MGDRRKAGAIGRLSWGIFFVGFGILWLTQGYHEMSVWSLVLILGGCILILGNLARAAVKVRISVGSLGIGFILLLVGGAMLQEIKLNWFGLLLLLIGAWVLLDVVAKRR